MTERVFSIPKRFIRVYVEGYLELEDDSSAGASLVSDASAMVAKAVHEKYNIPFTVINSHTET